MYLSLFTSSAYRCVSTLSVIKFLHKFCIRLLWCLCQLVVFQRLPYHSCLSSLSSFFYSFHINFSLLSWFVSRFLLYFLVFLTISVHTFFFSLPTFYPISLPIFLLSLLSSLHFFLLIWFLLLQCSLLSPLPCSTSSRTYWHHCLYLAFCFAYFLLNLVFLSWFPSSHIYFSSLSFSPGSLRWRIVLIYCKRRQFLYLLTLTIDKSSSCNVFTDDSHIYTPNRTTPRRCSPIVVYNDELSKESHQTCN